MATRAIVMQQKTQRPVQFEITQAARDALKAWIRQGNLKSDDFLFPSCLHESPHLGTRQYARILGHWVDEIVWTMERIRCVAQKPHSFTNARRTCELFSCFSVIRSLNQQSGILELRSMTR